MQTRETVLLIEDEENISDFMATSLRAQGYKAVCAKTAAEGIALSSSLCPDLILLDLGLPDRDGMDVIKSAELVDAAYHRDIGAEPGKG